MPHQVALTLVAKVRPGEAGSLKELLETMGDGVANGSVVDLGALDGVHFARFVVLDEATDLRGEPLPASLLYMSDLDVSRERHLGQLVDQSGEGLDRLFGHCEGYPEGRQRTREGRLDYLRRHRVEEQAFYVNTVGRTRRQIREEAELRDSLEDFLDGAERPAGHRTGGDPARASGSTSRPTACSAARCSRRPGSTSASGCVSSGTSSASRCSCSCSCRSCSSPHRSSSSCSAGTRSETRPRT